MLNRIWIITLFFLVMVAAPLAAQDMQVTTTDDTPVDLVLQAPDGAIAPLTFVVDVLPGSGRLYGEAPYLVYQPNPGFIGEDRLTYSVVDSTGQVTSATVVILVKGATEQADDVTDMPDGLYQTSRNTSVEIDLVPGVDYAFVQQPEHGVLSGQVPHLVYQPDEGFLGTDRFQYEVSVEGQSQTLEVTVEIGLATLFADTMTAIQSDDIVPTLPGLSPVLAHLVTQRSASGSGQSDLVFSQQSLYDYATTEYVNGNNVTVLIHATADADLVANLVSNAGGSVRHVFNPYLLADLPINALSALGSSDAIQFIDVPPKAISTPVTAQSDMLPQYGLVTSEGVSASNADAWHVAGYTGQDVRIGVIDNGFDQIAEHTAEVSCLQTAESAPSVPYQDTPSGQDVEGLNVVAILCDMAPDADVFAYQANNFASFVDAVIYLTQTKQVDMLVTALTFPVTAGDGSGPASVLVDTTALDLDVMFVVAAGDMGSSHYEGAFYESGIAGIGTELHNFNRNGAVDVLNRVNGDGYVDIGEHLCQVLIWDDWAQPITNDLNLILYYSYNGVDNWTPYVDSDAVNADTGYPVEGICFDAQEAGYYAWAIDNSQSDKRVWMQLIDYDAGYSTLQYDYHLSSVVSPADSQYAFVVSAVDVQTSALETYSGYGPANSQTPDGGATAGNGLGFFQPQLAGFTNTTTNMYVESSFPGTRAATAHVAGAAALVLGAFPDYTRTDVENFLRSRALSSPWGTDPGDMGPDTRYGYGYLWLGDPLVTACSIDTPGIFRGDGGWWFLKSTHGAGYANIVEQWGRSTSVPFSGDWDGDGVDTVGTFDIDYFSLKLYHTVQSNGRGVAFGLAGDMPVIGDWNGDGIDTIGVYRPTTGTWYLTNTNSYYAPIDYVFTFGLPNETPVTGDWDGDGKDTVGIFRSSDSSWYLRNSNSSGYADAVITFGVPATDIPVTGDWDGDCVDTIGIFRQPSATWYLKNQNATGYADISYSYGSPFDVPVTGDWDGN
ncbi:MAG: hypothetical protein CL607_23565 [Anaerolineaceae bacterium]|nr:hypothetical protein [Anaerolineaceae bacterium]